VIGLVFIGPAVVLVLALLLRWFPGERRLRAIAQRRRRRNSRAPSLIAVVSRPTSTLLPRGSALLASALASRPPPRLAIG
jgi:hypothetical protein